MNFKPWGGRKQFNGYLYTLVVVIGACFLHPSFEAFAGAIGLGLLGTSTIIMAEDVKKPSAAPQSEEH